MFENLSTLFPNRDVEDILIYDYDPCESTLFDIRILKTFLKIIYVNRKRCADAFRIVPNIINTCI